jgi:hypothetical protein
MTNVGRSLSCNTPLCSGQCAGGVPAWPLEFAYASFRNVPVITIPSHINPKITVETLWFLSGADNILNVRKKTG